MRAHRGIGVHDIYLVDILFPVGRDYAWLAMDASRHIGIFTNAGDGPIPLAVLANRGRTDRAEKVVLHLPERGGYEMLVKVPRPDDFIAFARRGLYAYDWQDALAARIESSDTSYYAVQSCPFMLIRLAQM